MDGGRGEGERESQLRAIPKLAFRTPEGREFEEVVKNGSKVSGLRWSRLGGQGGETSVQLQSS